ncbi:MAG: TOBE domain-containing protein, partial [Synergistaceae bacterium]|nr:TOBE domain-containing protein [Synergistaceae bacterium]
RIRVSRPNANDAGAAGQAFNFEGVVESQEYYGLYIKYTIRAGGQILKAIEKNDGINIYEPGEKVLAGINLTDVMSYDA